MCPPVMCPPVMLLTKNNENSVRRRYEKDVMRLRCCIIFDVQKQRAGN